jgi:hypothetical protein
VIGPVYVAQKGGCCLAYTRPPPPPLNIDELDAHYRAYLERFPQSEPHRRYCSTCSLRDFADCEARQLFWLEQLRDRVAPADDPGTESRSTIVGRAIQSRLARRRRDR